MRNLMFIIMVEYCQRMNENRLSVKILSFFSKITHMYLMHSHTHSHKLECWKEVERRTTYEALVFKHTLSMPGYFHSAETKASVLGSKFLQDQATWTHHYTYIHS